MKTKKLFWILVIVCLGTATLTAQNKQKKKKEKENAIKELIESSNYKIDVSMAYPQKGGSVSLTSLYSLEIRNDSIISYLPFYGRAYSIPYGGGNALSFKAPIDEYDVKYNLKKKKAKVDLKAKTSEDAFHFTLEIFFNGSSRIDVIMRNRDSMHYSGEIDLLPF